MLFVLLIRAAFWPTFYQSFPNLILFIIKHKTTTKKVIHLVYSLIKEHCTLMTQHTELEIGPTKVLLVLMYSMPLVLLGVGRCSYRYWPYEGPYVNKGVLQRSILQNIYKISEVMVFSQFKNWASLMRKVTGWV